MLRKRPSFQKDSESVCHYLPQPPLSHKSTAGQDGPTGTEITASDAIQAGTPMERQPLCLSTLLEAVRSRSPGMASSPHGIPQRAGGQL